MHEIKNQCVNDNLIQTALLELISDFMLRLFLCGGNFKNIVVKAIFSNCMIVNYGGNLKC